jgi:hypothetical protein
MEQPPETPDTVSHIRVTKAAGICRTYAEFFWLRTRGETTEEHPLLRQPLSSSGVLKEARESDSLQRVSERHRTATYLQIALGRLDPTSFLSKRLMLPERLVPEESS